jgi:hypothetical protein
MLPLFSYCLVAAQLENPVMVIGFETFCSIPSLASFSGWNWVELIAALFVAVGCVGEMICLFFKGPKKEEWINAREFEETKLKWEKFFAVIVALGVTAELFCLIRSIPEAIQRDKDVAKLKNTNAWIWQTNLALQKEVIEGQSKLAALQLRIQWRTITPEQKKVLIETLSPLARTLAPEAKKVVIETAGENPEPREYAARITEVLGDCGFDATWESGSIFFGMPGKGLRFEIKDRANAPPHAQALVMAFLKIRASTVRSAQNPDLKDNAVHIWVLPKPDE